MTYNDASQYGGALYISGNQYTSVNVDAVIKRFLFFFSLFLNLIVMYLLFKCFMVLNTASVGGAIYITSQAKVSITDTQITTNQASSNINFDLSIILISIN